MLEVDDIDVWRGASQTLHGVSLRVGAGEIVALLGGNGAGKTTTLATISGLLRPRSGRIVLSVGERTQDLSRLSPEAIVRLGLAHCPEGRQVFGGLSVAENLAMGAFLRRDGEVDADLDRLYGLFPILKERRAMRAGQLSGGEQMMLALARALMSRPKLLMLDEPSLGLAPQVIDQIFDTIETIRTEGTTILLVEQNAAMALEIADRAYVVDDGRIALEGPAAALAEDPAVRAAYLGIGEDTLPAEAP